MIAATNDCKHCPAKAGQHHKMSCAVGGAYRRIEAVIAPAKPAKAISFNDPMVRAIMDGRKTMTRRPMNPQPSPGCSYTMNGAGTHALHFEGDAWPALGLPALVPARDSYRLASPYQPGDRPWVRERARLIETASGLRVTRTAYGSDLVRLRYEADGALSDWLPYPARLKLLCVGQCIPNGCYREAARTFLEVTKVRVERLQDISEEDAIAEGIHPLPGQEGEPGCWWTGDLSAGPSMHARTPLAAFRLLWNSIYGPAAWDRNDWVWVTEFEVEK